MTKGIIALDLDGTLLDASGKYSFATRDYLRELTRRGYTIVLSTGRPPRSIMPIYDDIGCSGPIIAYNGSLVFHPLNQMFPRIDKTFSAASIRRIVQRTSHFVDIYMCESADHIYVNRVEPPLGLYFPFEGMKVIEGNLESTLNEDLYTALFRCPSGRMEELREACDVEEGIAWRSWNNSNYSELYFPGYDKGHAMDFIIRALDVKREDVYAFGDAANDIGMLERAGHAYAMKENKAPHLMERFEKTQGSAQEEGVLRTLRLIFGD